MSGGAGRHRGEQQQLRENRRAGDLGGAGAERMTRGAVCASRDKEGRGLEVDRAQAEPEKGCGQQTPRRHRPGNPIRDTGGKKREADEFEESEGRASTLGNQRAERGRSENDAGHRSGSLTESENTPSTSRLLVLCKSSAPSSSASTLSDAAPRAESTIIGSAE